MDIVFGLRLEKCLIVLSSEPKREQKTDTLHNSFFKTCFCWCTGLSKADAFIGNIVKLCLNKRVCLRIIWMNAVGFRFLDIMIRQQKEKASLTKLICFLMKQLCDVSVTRLHPPTHPPTHISLLFRKWKQMSVWSVEIGECNILCFLA